MFLIKWFFNIQILQFLSLGWRNYLILVSLIILTVFNGLFSFNEAFNIQFIFLHGLIWAKVAALAVMGFSILRLRFDGSIRLLNELLRYRLLLDVHLVVLLNLCLIKTIPFWFPISLSGWFGHIILGF